MATVPRNFSTHLVSIQNCTKISYVYRINYRYENCVLHKYNVWMNEMPRFLIIRKYDWFISQRTSQIQIRSKSF